MPEKKQIRAAVVTQANPASIINKAIRRLVLPGLNIKINGKTQADKRRAHPLKKRVSIKLYISVP